MSLCRVSEVAKDARIDSKTPGVCFPEVNVGGLNLQGLCHLSNEHYMINERMALLLSLEQLFLNS